MILDRITSRRHFLKVGAAAGGGMVLSLSLPFADSDAQPAGAGSFVPNAFVRIAGNGQVTMTMPYVEMGQATYTSIPMLIAEELEVDLKQVQLEHAPPNAKLYGNPVLGGEQVTGNSSAIRAAWQPLRQAGAVARTMLVAAAAKRWNVDPATCRAQAGEVLHPSGKKLKYGELAAEAAKMPVPKDVALKQPKDFKLIGTSAKRLDTPAKVNGTAVYGIDVRPPGVKIATLAQSPVFGGTREERGRRGGQGGQGRPPDRAARRCRRRGGRPHGRREEGAGSLEDRMGRRAARQAGHRRHRGRPREGNAQAGAGGAEHRRCREGHGRAPSPRSRRHTRCRSWRMPRWSR